MATKMDELQDQVVLVTGASSGIGAAIAIEFAKHNVRLALTGRDRGKLEATSRECQQVGLSPHQILIVTGDLMQDDDVKHVVQSVVNHYGTIHILVNNAGGTVARMWNTLEWEDFDYVMRLNTRSYVMVTREAAPHLITNKGCIVNVSSVAGLKASPISIAYCCSKSAVDEMGKLLALELGPLGVRVNTVNPAHVTNTDLFTRPDGPVKRPEDLEKFFQSWLPYYPLGRMGKSDDIGPVVVFLCTKQASFVHGINMPIDGGHLVDPRMKGVYQ